MDAEILGLWNGWSILCMILLAFTLVETGDVCSRRGLSQWLPAFTFIAGVLATCIFMQSGLITLLVSIPITLVLAMLISILLVPQWKPERDATKARPVSGRSRQNA